MLTDGSILIDLPSAYSEKTKFIQEITRNNLDKSIELIYFIDSSDNNLAWLQKDLLFVSAALGACRNSLSCQEKITMKFVRNTFKLQLSLSHNATTSEDMQPDPIFSNAIFEILSHKSQKQDSIYFSPKSDNIQLDFLTTHSQECISFWSTADSCHIAKNLIHI